MQPAKAIRAELSDRLLGELPRFFGGRLAAFRELFQNAYRAGAQNVSITIKDNVLTFEDDGTGCPDPAMLLRAGATGWDEGKVIEPAGLGFFALLSKDVSEMVEAESHGWRLRMAPADVLAGAPVEVLPGEWTRGMRISLTLARSDPEFDITDARGYYPYRVVLNGSELPVRAWNPDLVFETSVGRAGIFADRYQHKQGAVWEYRAIRGDAFDKALDKAAEGDPIARALRRSFVMQWFVHPASGVRPKLPDRNDLQESSALAAAAATLLATITGHFKQEATRITKSWPRSFRQADVPGAPEWLLKTPLGKEVLAWLGWARIDEDDWSEANIYFVDDDDGWVWETSGISAYSKDCILVAEAHVAASINNAVELGFPLPWAIVDAKHGKQVAVEGLRKGRENGWVDLAREVRLGGHKLPFLLDDTSRHGRVILPCDADAAVAAIMGIGEGPQTPTLDQILQAFLVAQDYDTLSSRWGDYEDKCPDMQKVEYDLVQQVSEDFLPESLARARETLYKLKGEQRKVRSLRVEAERLAEDPLLQPVPQIAALLEAANAAEEALGPLLVRARGAARLPAME